MELGGGFYGHLALIMPAANYITMDGAIDYVAPMHPGVQADAAANATVVRITQQNRQHDKALERHMLHTNVSNAQATAVRGRRQHVCLLPTSSTSSEFTSLTAPAPLQHLVDTYNIVIEETLEVNRSRLGAEWNPDEGMEVLYTRITTVQQFAVISDATAIHLVLTALEQTGMLTDACADWRKRAPGKHTLLKFKSDMDHAWKARNRHLKAKDVGYHNTLSASMQALSAGKENVPPNKVTTSVSVGNVLMYYCPLHGLGFSEKHTSHTCNSNKKEGHQDDATIKVRKGGSTNLNIGGGRNRTT